MVFTITKDPFQYKLAQAVGPYIIKYHCRWTVYLPFLNENISVVQAKFVTPSSYRG